MIQEEFKDTLQIDSTIYQVEGLKRNWNPLSGHTPPSESVWEVITRCHNEILYAAGATREEAIRNLDAVIRRKINISQ